MFTFLLITAFWAVVLILVLIYVDPQKIANFQAKVRGHAKKAVTKWDDQQK